MEGQNQNPINPGNMDPNMGNNMMPPAEEKSHFGAISGIVIIVVILILGGLYFWGKELNNEASTPAENTMTNGAAAVMDESTKVLETQGTSDNISDIEADLNSTNLENLDADLQSI